MVVLDSSGPTLSGVGWGGGGGGVDEVIAVLFRGVLWLVGQVVRAVVEAIAGELVENCGMAVKRRFAARRRVSLAKGAPGS